MRIPLSAAAATMLMLAPAQLATAQSTHWQNPAEIDGAVVQFTGVQIGSPGGARSPVDRRVRLANCRNPLAVSWRNARRDMVLVECPDIGGWRMFVPVMSNQAAPSVVAAKPQVKRGQAVTISVRGRGFAISQPGEALENGRIGDWIKVKPMRAKETLKAKIVDPGLVEVTLR